MLGVADSNTRDDPEVKAVSQKQIESYKAKTQALKGQRSTGKRRP